MWTLKYDTNDHICETERTLLPRWVGGEFGNSRYKLSHTGRMNKVPQHDTENHIQDPEIDYKAKEHKKGCVCTHTHTEVYI